MSLATAYAMRKKSMGMARGGMCEHGSTACDMCHGGKMMADGGMMEEKSSGYRPMPEAHDNMNEMADMEDEDMISRIMKQRYSKGGRVANETGPSADFQPNEFDDLVKDDDLESSYDGANSGDELGNEQEDEDRRDIISKIMKARKMKDRLPRPA